MTDQNTIPPPSRSRNHDKAFQAWLLEGKADFGHSALLDVCSGGIGHTSLLLKKGTAMVDGIQLHPSMRTSAKMIAGTSIVNVVPRTAEATAKLAAGAVALVVGFGLPVPGVVSQTTEFYGECGIEVALTPNQYRALQSDMAYYQKQGACYNAFDIGPHENCTSFCLTLLKGVGVDVRAALPTRTLIDAGLLPSTMAKAAERASQQHAPQEFTREKLGGEWCRYVTHRAADQTMRLWRG